MLNDFHNMKIKHTLCGETVSRKSILTIVCFYILSVVASILFLCVAIAAIIMTIKFFIGL